MEKELKALRKFMQQVKIDENVLEKLGTITKKGRYLFVCPKRLHKIIKDTGKDFFSVGNQIGEIKKDFEPTIWFINFLSRYSDNKVIVNEKSEWMFQCGKDIFKKGIKDIIGRNRGMTFIQNIYNENLGIARFTNNNEIPLKNILDNGKYVRKR